MKTQSSFPKQHLLPSVDFLPCGQSLPFVVNLSFDISYVSIDQSYVVQQHNSLSPPALVMLASDYIGASIYIDYRDAVSMDPVVTLTYIPAGLSIIIVQYESRCASCTRSVS